MSLGWISAGPFLRQHVLIPVQNFKYIIFIAYGTTASHCFPLPGSNLGPTRTDIRTGFSSVIAQFVKQHGSKWMERCVGVQHVNLTLAPATCFEHGNAHVPDHDVTVLLQKSIEIHQYSTWPSWFVDVHRNIRCWKRRHPSCPSTCASEHLWLVLFDPPLQISTVPIATLHWTRQCSIVLSPSAPLDKMFWPRWLFRIVPQQEGFDHLESRETYPPVGPATHTVWKSLHVGAAAAAFATFHQWGSLPHLFAVGIQRALAKRGKLIQESCYVRKGRKRGRKHNNIPPHYTQIIPNPKTRCQIRIIKINNNWN